MYVNMNDENINMHSENFKKKMLMGSLYVTPNPFLLPRQDPKKEKQQLHLKQEKGKTKKQKN